ncbi:glycosyltransferase family 2 protein [Pseudomonas sp. GD03858]|uniref:glycosyltransferase family 2 protein n=1 Tax=unclassified Pseudomonas TaxID=196821 RepID=UPI0024479064|nr:MULTISPECIES: glycosyltransferase family 2 protein [unclassified Pseudomonas]MDH0646306.1 glycosyltransferase family 2 protein [Pseudomonas sp. GD03867]MDH0662039.1 glycosyltransferase family 2 protein [Pseudomonas sp. GD03858]
MRKLNIILLAARETNSVAVESSYPAYLAERDGLPLIEHLVESCLKLEPASITCMLPKADVSKFHLRNMLHQMSPIASVLPVHALTMGAACTALLAAQSIDNDDELLILSCNELLDASLEDIVARFRGEECDAGVVVFKSLHPRYSFVRKNSDGCVVEAAEKNPISNHAVAGLYWFAKGSVFVEAVKEMIRKDAKVNDAYYIAPSLNELVLLHKKIGTFRVDPSQYHPLKNSHQLHAFENVGPR